MDAIKFFALYVPAAVFVSCFAVSHIGKIHNAAISWIAAVSGGIALGAAVALNI